MSESNLAVLGRPLLFFDAEYKAPAELVKEKQKVTVRFAATGTGEVAAVYGIRVVRA